MGMKEINFKDAFTSPKKLISKAQGMHIGSISQM